MDPFNIMQARSACLKFLLHFAVGYNFRFNIEVDNMFSCLTEEITPIESKNPKNQQNPLVTV